MRAKQDSKAHQLVHHIGDPVLLAGALGLILLLGFAPLSALPLRDIAVLRLPLRGPPSATLRTRHAARVAGDDIFGNGALSGQLSCRGLAGERVLGRVNGERFAMRD